jgi:aromatic-amino-acid transaminase
MTTESIFGTINPYPGDPILTLNETFKADARATKINLGIGIYTDETGQLPVLGSVALAESRSVFAARPYLPMEGHAGYRASVQHLIFGADHEVVTSSKVATIQSVGGTGALAVAADFLADHCPGRTVYISDPAWDNHHALFRKSGFETRSYPWCDDTHRVAAPERTAEALRGAPNGSIIVMQPVCHNPTGIDLSVADQDMIAALCVEKGHIVVFDMAYQGFGDGLDADADWLRRCASSSMSFLVVNSFSKNFSLYGERCGGLSVVCQSSDEAALVLGQLKLVVRRSYSNPPMSGALLIAAVLGDPELRAMWENEVGVMRNRMRDVRVQLQAAVAARDASVDASFLTEQRGMFSFTGLSIESVQRMRTDDAIYLIDSGRMCVAGLNDAVIDRVADSLARELAL